MLEYESADSGKFRAALLLAWIAGSVDAIGYLNLAQVFTAHMSGNSVAFGVHLGQGDLIAAVQRGFPILPFIGGVFGMTLLTESMLWRRARYALPLALVIEGMLIAAFWASFGRAGFYGGVALLSGAMGVQNVTLRNVAGVNVRTTFVTGMLTDFAQSLAATVQRKEAARSEARMRTRLAGAIFGLYVLGGISGSLADVHAGIVSVALPLFALCALAVRVAFVPLPNDDPEPHRKLRPS